MKKTTNNTPPTRRVQTLQGTVVRRSGDKTVAVLVRRVVKHPMYRKRATLTQKYLAHDEKNEAKVGDHVTIKASRPLSARKRWAVVSSTAGKPIS